MYTIFLILSGEFYGLAADCMSDAAMLNPVNGLHSWVVHNREGCITDKSMAHVRDVTAAHWNCMLVDAKEWLPGHKKEC